MKPATVPAPAKLRRLLTSRGLRAKVVLTRADGEPVGDDDLREARGLVEMLDIVDARVTRALAVVARAIPAKYMPFPFVDPTEPPKKAPKRVATKAAPRRATRRGAAR